MRGIDYRCTTVLHLLICTPLPSERAYDQALGRVERFVDSGSRSIVTGVSNFDEITNLEILGGLTQTTKARREAKKNRRKAAKAKDAKVPQAAKKDADSVSHA